ncbi:murein hydrolase activator EnvC family protein [Salinibacillus xinjiangensis]|uniref:murein hydrolase activator EnvC family protein n=1 Tax=Salinibacillus xinjiangensis TaxID=1229268 RepID=UPI002B26A256|nr:peptidoglycan DD-metalloendopeptidase family protein [Salinibacillus xinjiangensis]
MKNRIIALLSVFALISLTFTFSDGSKTYATSESELRQEINEIEKKKEEVDSEQVEIEGQKSETEQKIAENQAEQDRINSQIRDIDMKVTNTENDIREKKNEISQTEEEINKLKEEIKKLKERIAERDKLLKNRLKNLQKNGGSISYLEVLLGAKSFGDFLDRSTAVSKIMDSDRQILDKQKSEKEQLQNDQAEVEKKKETLVAQKEKLESMKQELAQQRADKESLMASLEAEEKELHKHKLSLKEQQQILANEKAAFNKLISQKEKELEQLKSPPPQSQSHGAPAVTNGNFMRPATGRITSGYGPRWGSLHPGIDIGKNGRSGDVPIVASAGGIVSNSYYSTSYGNVVFITHYIDNQKYTTVYAHLSRRDVSNNQLVKKGQQIGLMGNTGDSTGPHLHFELHVGSWNYAKSNSVNPYSYVNF